MSDPQPAQRMREVLARRRARGEPWDTEIYNHLVDVLVGGLPRSERESWSYVFSSQRDDVWKSAYEGALAFRNGLDAG